VRQLLSYERDRVRYLLKAYLRARLSPAEVRFAQQFFVALGRSLKTSVLDDLPAQYQSLVSA
jgi:hypothetical protein